MKYFFILFVTLFLLLTTSALQQQQQHANYSYSGVSKTSMYLFFEQDEKYSQRYRIRTNTKGAHMTTYSQRKSKETISDEAQMTTPEIIRKHNYPSEVHTVETDDGYILEMHRIPGRTNFQRSGNEQRPVAFLMHGIIASSSDFILNGPGNALGYLLSDAGFDVWLGNARGNRYSKKHKTIPSSRMAFWDFSFHEIGVFDLPAMIDYILEMTGQEQLCYIGHSQGTTVYYILLSERPEYNNKIIMGFHLSPVVYLKRLKSPILKFFSHFTSLETMFLKVIGIGEFFPKTELIRKFSNIICGPKSPRYTRSVIDNDDWKKFLCINPTFLLFGFTPQNLNATMFPIYAGHNPAGSSTRQFMHYGQIIQSGVFKQFDFGILKNKFKYGRISAPKYQLSNVCAKTVIFTSANDWFAQPEDVSRLVNEIPTIENIVIKDRKFSHIDFIFGNNAKEMVYDKLIALMLNDDVKC